MIRAVQKDSGTTRLEVTKVSGKKKCFIFFSCEIIGNEENIIVTLFLSAHFISLKYSVKIQFPRRFERLRWKSFYYNYPFVIDE